MNVTGGSSSPSGGETESLADQLTRLHDLRQQGALSDEEYAAAKQQVLASGPASHVRGGQAVSRPAAHASPIDRREATNMPAQAERGPDAGASIDGVRPKIARARRKAPLIAACVAAAAAATYGFGSSTVASSCYVPFERASGATDCADDFVSDGQQELTPRTAQNLRTFVGVQVRNEDGALRDDCEVAAEYFDRNFSGEEVSVEKFEYSFREGGRSRGNLERIAGTANDYDILLACMWLIVQPGD